MLEKRNKKTVSFANQEEDRCTEASPISMVAVTTSAQLVQQNYNCEHATTKHPFYQTEKIPDPIWKIKRFDRPCQTATPEIYV